MLSIEGYTKYFYMTNYYIDYYLLYLVQYSQQDEIDKITLINKVKSIYLILSIIIFQTKSNNQSYSKA